MQPQQLIILGGGTAGWICANLLALALPANWQISLLESPQIGTIGVGEGATPQLRLLFEKLGLAETNWMPQCHATYKTGIRFQGWSTKAGFDHYFHPFPSAIDDETAKGCYFNGVLRRKGMAADAHPDSYFLASQLAQLRRLPLSDTAPFALDYAYHFDAGLLGKLLQQQAVSRGVTHLVNQVSQVRLTPGGDIASLHCVDGLTLAGDFFVDCSGFHGRLLQQALAEPFISYADNLFNNAAVAIATPVGQQPRPQTTATAMQYGWRWHIPLTSRVGNGYVYSQHYISADQAETELRRELGLLDADISTRHLQMKVGRVANSWQRNCLAVGLAQGFIEPLEATALLLVQETVNRFIQHWQAGQPAAGARQAFNQYINGRFDGIRDYIVCHYKVNSRTDTEYWRANAANQQLSDSLQQLLAVWHSGEALSDELRRQQIGQHYPLLSWQCLLSGYGIFPDAASLKPLPPQLQRYHAGHIASQLQQLVKQHFPQQMTTG
ncbi:tryptophan halogenase family protein [Arsukibacterium perlucidum]|uniref:tryptophan halogenase family protein n=1 Tax=Arsukibacterium perlucidum TaxID=368811 RepID=UPI0003675BFA|nr:tryptophan halogenase family protein [Arsukibacterium perlucidum]